MSFDIERNEFYMQGQFSNISIEGIKAVVPPHVIDNMQYAQILGEKRCKKQIRLTGIKQRRVSPPGQTSADLAYAAGNQLLDALGWDPATVDVLIFATQNPIFAVPSTAFFLQKRLGINKDCVVFDINLGCSAAMVGIQVVASLLQQGRPDARGLLIISDPVFEPGEVSPAQLADQMLFGSAGAAVALQRTEGTAPCLAFRNCSDGERYRAIFRPIAGNAEMDGTAVFEFGINDVAEDIRCFRSSLGLQNDKIDYYVFHQAQALMLTAICNACDILPEQELRSLERFGNTNGSSIPVTLCAQERNIWSKEWASFLLCGFGVGLSWCSIYMTMNTKRIYPLSISDDIYKE